MSFSSFVFLKFFIIFLLVYHCLPKNIHFRNLYIIAGSYLFYAWWDWRFLGLLVAASAVNYLAAIIIEDRVRWKRAALISAVAINLGILATFKYYGFFVTNLKVALLSVGVTSDLTTMGIILPIGISFYTFQTLSYTIDVYRGDYGKAERNPLVFFAYVSFFPQLVAGPIERAHHLLGQFRNFEPVSKELVRRGIWLLIWGYFLKTVVADGMAPLVDLAFITDQRYGWWVIIGTLAFGLQIYGDFCGYSYIAKGLAALMGFDLVWNFRHPYWASSMRDFWRRWHISLSQWLRDYLYIPLGGSRKGKLRTQINILITMLLGGLWHGAGWNFLLWGGLHGTALVIERVLAPLVILPRIILKPFGWGATMTVVFFGWFLFRARSWDMIAGMWSSFGNMAWVPGHGEAIIAILSVAAPLVLVEYWQEKRGDLLVVVFAEWKKRLAIQAALLLLIVAMSQRVKPEFIYFQF